MMGNYQGSANVSVSAPEYYDGGSLAVVSLAGQAGIEDGAWFRQLLQLPATQGQGRIVIDLSGLSAIDWWAALILLWVARVICRRGGVLVLASPRAAVARLLNTVDALHVVAVYDSVQQAAGTLVIDRQPAGNSN
jgi:anti-anti-sigma factor